jgi:hypothetical protein
LDGHSRAPRCHTSQILTEVVMEDFVKRHSLRIRGAQPHYYPDFAFYMEVASVLNADLLRDGAELGEHADDPDPAVRLAGGDFAERRLKARVLREQADPDLRVIAHPVTAARLERAVTLFGTRLGTDVDGRTLLEGIADVIDRHADEPTLTAFQSCLPFEVCERLGVLANEFIEAVNAELRSVLPR